MLPPGAALLNANQRLHWAVRARVTRQLRSAAFYLARYADIPRLPKARVVAEYRPPDTRRRDPANWAPSAKACVDGLIDAGVLTDDDHTHLIGPDMRIGEPVTRGRLILHLTELKEDS